MNSQLTAQPKTPETRQGAALNVLEEMAVRLARQVSILANIEDIVFSPKSPKPSPDPELVEAPNTTLLNALEFLLNRIETSNSRLSELEDALRSLFASENFHLV